MENCDNTRIFTDARIEVIEYDRNTWKPLMRQCVLSSGVCCLYFLQGLFLGTPTVLVAQIRGNLNSTVIITDEMLSWLTSTSVVSSLPFVVILPLLFNRIGRKRTFLLVWLLDLMGYVILYNSTDLYHILIGEVFAGPTFASTVTISPVIIAEYTSPKYRGILLTLKGATSFWGIWVSNAIGTFFYWKYIPIVSFVCSVYMISIITWPESPYWLATRGRYAESAKSHRWMRGVSVDSEKELAQLIVSQKNFNKTTSQSNVNCLSRICSIFKSHQFYKPASISVVLIAQFYFCGKFVISLYAIEVLKRITPDQSFVYKEMLILDGVNVFSMYVGCIVSRYFKRRTLLLLLPGTGILALYILSVYLYLASLSFISENSVVILFFLTVFSIAMCSGPLIMCTSIYGEIIPPRYQNTAMILVGVGGVTTMSFLLKVGPFMFKNFKMHGTFLFYAVTSTVLLVILYIYLPETKDKTIQEIENLFSKDKNLLPSTEHGSLLATEEARSVHHPAPERIDGGQVLLEQRNSKREVDNSIS